MSPIVIPGAVDRRLDSLSSEFLPIVYRMIARVIERGVMIMIVQTSRTAVQQRAALDQHTSTVERSKHLPRYLRLVGAAGDVDAYKADAIDVCPYEQYQLHGPDKLQWDATDPAWAAVRAAAELEPRVRAGAWWHEPVDPGHWEYLFTGERHADIPKTAAAFPMFGVAA